LILVITGHPLSHPQAGYTCSTCSGGQKVGFVGNGGTLTFNGVTAATSGTYQVTIAYCSGDPGRQWRERRHTAGAVRPIDRQL
jgi:hypothetical protein